MGHDTNESRAKAIFEAIVDLPAERRAKKLDDLCRGADDLKRSVEALIRSHESARREGLLAAPAVDRPRSTGSTGSASVGERPGDQIGPYKLLQVIGEGGFGVVFMAEQKEPVNRRVALKIIKHGMDTKQVVARFEAERQALALMDHPNIARVLDGGSTDRGRPYFVMDLVKGVEITQYCDENKLDVRERLELFGDVCRAIQHAHQKGVIHRDLKPSNVLVTLHDGNPVPIVIDFGIAKATHTELTNKTVFTEYGQMIGTPAYMSPEQAEMSGLDIDTRSDVYSLGVLLYELLTGTTPLDVQSLRERGFMALLQAIKESDPQKPSTRVSTAATAASTAAVRRADPAKLGALLRGDLDWIVMRCLEKDRSRRYDSAASLAADIERHLTGQVVTAVPPSRGYRLRKFVRRHRGPVFAAALVAVVLVLGVVGTTVGMTRAVDQADRAARELARANEVKGLIQSMLLGVTPEEAQGTDTALLRSILDDTAERLTSGGIEDELIEAELRLIVGFTYGSIAAYDEARQHLERALSIRERLLGPDAEETIDVREKIGSVELAEGRFEDAVKNAEEVLESLRTLHGEDSDAVLSARLRLGTAYWQAGLGERAEPLLRDVLDDATERLGAESDTALVCSVNLSSLYQAQGRMDEALVLLRNVVDTRRRTKGTDHPTTLLATSNLAAALRNLGELEEAARLLQGLVEAQVRVSGPDHPHTIAARVVHAGLLLRMGRTGEAQALLLAAREAADRSLAPGHHLHFGIDIELAEVYANQGRQPEAVAAAEQGADRARTILGKLSPRLPGILDRAARACTSVRRYDVAYRLRKEAVELLTERLGPDHESVIEVRLSRDDNATQLGMAAEVEPRIRALHEQLRASLGPAHPRTLRAKGVLADALVELGRWDEGERLFREILAVPDLEVENRKWIYGALISTLRLAGRAADAEEEIRAQIEWMAELQGPDALDVLLQRRELADVVRLQGRYADALALLEDARDDMQRLVGADHTLVLEVDCRLAVLLGAVKRLDEAEKLLLDVKARAERTTGPDHSVTVLVHHNLGRVYTDLQRHDDAGRAWQTAREIETRLYGAPSYQILDLLAGNRAGVGDPAGAADLYGQAAEAAERQHGDQHAARAIFLYRRAFQLRAAGDLDGAIIALRRALAVADATVPRTNPLRRDILELTVQIRVARREAAQQVPLLEELVELHGGLGEGATPRSLDHAGQLGRTYSQVGRHADAERVLGEALTAARRVAGAGSPQVGMLVLSLANAWHAQGKWEEATRGFEEGIEIFETTQGPESLVRVLGLMGLADTHHDRGDDDAALAVLEPLRPLARKLQRPGLFLGVLVDSQLIDIYAERDRIDDARALLVPLVRELERLLTNGTAEPSTPTVLASLLVHEWSPETHDARRALELARTGLEAQTATGEASRWEAMLVLARAQAANGDVAGAEAVFRNARELAPPGRRAEVDRAAQKAHR